jgi:hypothetical protein
MDRPVDNDDAVVVVVVEDTCMIVISDSDGVGMLAYWHIGILLKDFCNWQKLHSYIH